MRRPWIALLILAACAATVPAHGQNLDMGLPELNALNPSITGSGVAVAQVEALFGGTNNFEVDPGGVDQPASKFTYIDVNGSQALLTIAPMDRAMPRRWRVTFTARQGWLMG